MTIQAVYENGILKLLDPVDLDEDEVVLITIERRPENQRVYLCSNEKYAAVEPIKPSANPSAPEDEEPTSIEDLVDRDRRSEWSPF